MTYAVTVKTVYVDASPSGILCYVIGKDDPDFVELPKDLTNNHAEYMALIAALKDSRIKFYDNVQVYTDSKLVAEQIARKLDLRRGWRCTKSHLRKSMNVAARIINGKCLIFAINHVPREESLAGVALEKYLEYKMKARVALLVESG